MPLYDIPAQQALEARKANPNASWGDRNEVNRVEPIAKPAFEVPFRIKPGEHIFTVGSCFARNVEDALQRRGFVLPMRDLLLQPEFRGLEFGIINNFGTPSIYNEFAWAFGEREFVNEDHILEVGGDKFADLHLVSTIRPGPWSSVIERRRGITAAYNTARQCRVIVMTLGLVETWFDTKTGYYLNAIPRPSFVRNEPDRFRLHVLEFNEALGFLNRTMDLLKRHGRSDLQVLLTVSPVPLTVTLRDQDVMVANAYSKAVLRAVAETVVSQHSFVSYYPSYESVTLSDRKLAWRDDLIHVTQDLINTNVSRMVDAFIEDEVSLDSLTADIEAGGIPAAIVAAQKVSEGTGELAERFYGSFGHLSGQSLEFALVYAEYLALNAKHEEAIAVLSSAPAFGKDAQKVEALIGRELLALGRPQEAIDHLEPLVAGGPAKSYAIWLTLLQACMAAGDAERAIGVVTRWSRVAPSRSCRANYMLGSWLHQRGDSQRGLGFLRNAVAMDVEDVTAKIILAEVLLSLGQRDEARTAVAGVVARGGSDSKRLGRVRDLLQ
jgi:tetratricopeptide (TPR) repeat protein